MIRRLTQAGLLALLLVHVVPAYAINDPAEALPNAAEEARAERIGRQLRCLVCQNESIEDSGADLARDLRKIVRQQVATGASDQQVIAWLVARYGDFVRLKPPFNAVTSLLWASPVVALLAGLLLALFGRRQRAAQAAPLTEDEHARLRGLIEP
jgi:cytochrome c-type biogenesis protein CcmH